MRIVFNTDSLIMGGAEKLALQYVTYLSKNFEVILLINEDNGDDGNALIDKIPQGVKFYYVVDKKIIEKINKYRELKGRNFLYKLPYSYYLKQKRKNYRKNIRKILNNMEYDILIDFSCKIPEDIVDRRTLSWLHTSISKLKKKKEMTKKFKKNKKTIVITKNMRKQFREQFPGIFNVELLYNPFNIEHIKKMSLDKTISVQDNKLLKCDYILSCSRLDKNKDLETLILAYNNIKEKIKEKLYLIGDGPERENLEKMVRELKLGDRVIFLGTRFNPYIWMRRARLFVHSSKEEGFGMVIVEALINSCVVVATDCPVGPSEILENGKYGILTPVGEVKKMEENILLGLTNQRLRKKLILGSQERIKKFSDEEIFRQFKNIILSEE